MFSCVNSVLSHFYSYSHFILALLPIVQAPSHEIMLQMQKTVKIPDMFLKGVKRKSTGVLAPLENKKMAVENVVETKKEPTKPQSEPKPDASFCLADHLKSESWLGLLQDELNKPYMKKVEKFLDEQYQKGTQIFPPQEEIFTAFNQSSLQDVSVVIIGQDPYHNDNQAHGLSFSVKKGVPPPPSLKNIYKELESDVEGFKKPDHGCLLGWAKQGVFLLNATLTVKAHEANSHAKIGWQTFTDVVIKRISEKAERPVVFLLWGGFAHKKELLVDKKRHFVLKTAHPSPLSVRKWTGCKCFSQTNELLEKAGRDKIDWCDL